MGTLFTDPPLIEVDEDDFTSAAEESEADSSSKHGKTREGCYEYTLYSLDQNRNYLHSLGVPFLNDRIDLDDRRLT